jgi:hypothetical protein
VFPGGIDRVVEKLLGLRPRQALMGHVLQVVVVVEGAFGHTQAVAAAAAAATVTRRTGVVVVKAVVVIIVLLVHILFEGVVVVLLVVRVVEGVSGGLCSDS